MRFCAQCGGSIGAAAAPGASPATAPVGGTAATPGPGGAGLPAGQQQTSALAVTAFIFSLIPACLWVVGLVLGIVALVRINERPNQLKGKGLAIAAIVLPAFWFFFGILAAIAIPNFIKFQARAKQSEARMNLKGVYTAEKSYEAEKDTPASDFKTIGFEPEPHRRYAYFMGTDAIQPDIPNNGPFELSADIREQLPQDTVAVAVGNIDHDPTLDVWAIDKQGEVHHVIDDLDH